MSYVGCEGRCYSKRNDFENANILQCIKAFLSDTPQSIKRQNKVPKEQDGKYIPSCRSK